MIITVPSGVSFHLDFISAASDKEGINTIGIFVNNTLKNVFTFKSDLNFEIHIAIGGRFK